MWTIILIPLYNIFLENQEVKQVDSSVSGKRSEAERIRELNELSRLNFEEQSYMNANISYKLIDLNEIRFTYDVSLFGNYKKTSFKYK